MLGSTRRGPWVREPSLSGTSVSARPVGGAGPAGEPPIASLRAIRAAGSSKLLAEGSRERVAPIGEGSARED